MRSLSSLSPVSAWRCDLLVYHHGACQLYRGRCLFDFSALFNMRRQWRQAGRRLISEVVALYAKIAQSPQQMIRMQIFVVNTPTAACAIRSFSTCCLVDVCFCVSVWNEGQGLPRDVVFVPLFRPASVTCCTVASLLLWFVRVGAKRTSQTLRQTFFLLRTVLVCKKKTSCNTSRFAFWAGRGTEGQRARQSSALSALYKQQDNKWPTRPWWSRAKWSCC